MKLSLIDSALELDFDTLSHADTSDFVEPEMFHRFGRSGALRVEHGTLGHDGDDGFHASTISCPALAHKPIMISAGDMESTGDGGNGKATEREDLPISGIKGFFRISRNVQLRE
jgi:hypothetical protein